MNATAQWAAPNKDAKTSAIQVMVVDDSAVIRGLIQRLIDREPDMQVVASASNGQAALSALVAQPIDVVVLDLEMPIMDGMTALPRILKAAPGIKVIIASTLSLHNAEVSLNALQAGASDYIPKPSAVRDIAGGEAFRRDLVAKVRTLAARRVKARIADTAAAARTRSAGSSALYAGSSIVLRGPGPKRPEVIAVGSSTGGPQALFKFLGSLNRDMKVPVLITQHMPPTFTTILADHITRSSGWPAEEAQDGAEIRPGRVYLARGDFHMVVETRNGARVLRTNRDAPENFCRPAVDPMLRSIAQAYNGHALVVILTGMGQDGLLGAKVVVDAGGTVVAQDEATSVVWGMPGAVATGGMCTAVLPLDDLAPFVHRFVTRGLA